MDETIRAALLLSADRKERLAIANINLTALIASHRLPDHDRATWINSQPDEEKRKRIWEIIHAMDEAARDKAKELLGITELERYER